RVGEVYNIGGQSECENITLVRDLCHAIDGRFATEPALRNRFPDSPPAHGVSAASLISFVTDRLGHDRRYSINCSKAECELGFQPRRKLAAALLDTVDWYLARHA